MALTQVTVQGTVQVPESGGLSPAASGTITCKLTKPIQDTTGNQLLAANSIIEDIAADGSFSVSLTANDSPGIEPSGTAWQITIRIDGVPQVIQRLTVISVDDAPTVNLAALPDLSPASFPAPVSNLALKSYVDAQIAALSAGEIARPDATLDQKVLLWDDASGELADASPVLALKADLVGGVLPLNQVPPAAFDLVENVATIIDMLALDVSGKGALVRVADNGDGNPALFLLPAGSDPANEANWVEVSMDPEGAAAAAQAAAEAYTDTKTATEAAARIAAIEDQHTADNATYVSRSKVLKPSGGDDTNAINNALTAASAAGGGVVSLWGSPIGTRFKIGGGGLGYGVVVPSNVTVVLEDDAYLRVEDAAKVAAIRNSDLANGNTNVRVIGTGGAVIDHNAANQGGQVVVNPWQNVTVLLVKCSQSRISGIQIKGSNGWGLSPQACTDSDFDNITFRQDGAVPRQGGVNTADGGSDLRFNKLRGTTYDDFVALVSRTNADYAYAGTGGTLRRVFIDDVVGDCRNFRMVRILGSDGNEISTIRGNGIHSTAASGVGAENVVQLLTGSPYGAEDGYTQIFDIKFRGISGGAGASSGFIIGIEANCNRVAFESVCANAIWKAIIGQTTGYRVDDLTVSDVEIYAVPSPPGVLLKVPTGAAWNRPTIDGVRAMSASIVGLYNNAGTIDKLKLFNMNGGSLTGTAFTNTGTITNRNVRNVFFGTTEYTDAS